MKFDRSIEKLGSHFDKETFFRARSICIQTVNQTIAQVNIGMNEADIKHLVEQNFLKVGIKKFWHPTKIRIASDTVKSFRELSDQHLKTQLREICFIDVGPILENHEADFGQTFLVKSSEKSSLIETCHKIFQETSKKWASEGLTGFDLYRFANEMAEKSGYVLNPLSAGHRIGDFPHRLHSQAGLSDVDLSPSQNLWILEIHVIDPKINVGAFYEDLLR